MPSTIASSRRIGNSTAWAASATWATASAFYVVGIDTAGVKIAIDKSTDGTTWAVQDAANAPTVNAAANSYSSWLHTDGYLYVARFTATSTINVRRFNTATDTWEATDLGTGSAATTGLNSRPIRVAVRSSGDVLVAYQDASFFILYSRRVGTTWTTAQSVKGASARLGDLTVDGSDVAYFFYGDDANNDNSFRTLNSSNVLGTEGDFDTTAHTTAKVMSSIAVLWNDGTLNKVAWLGRDTGGELDFYHGTQSATPSFTAVSGVSTSVTVRVTSVALAVFGSKIYACWDDGSNNVVYDATTSLTTLTFGTDTTLVAAVGQDTIPQFIAHATGGLGIVYHSTLTAISVEWISLTGFGGGATTVDVPVATATGAAVVPSVQALVLAPAAAATATAPPPLVAPSLPPVATATGSALTPTIQARVLIPLAAAIGVASPSTLIASIPVPSASATGSSATPTIRAIVTVPVATATGDALIPTVISTAGQTVVSVPLATATGAGLTPTMLVSVLVPIATASASTQTPTMRTVAAAPVAIATGAALTPSILASIPVPLATATGIALTSTERAIVSVPVATATGAALAPIVAPSLPPVATASGAAFAPTIRAIVSVPVATALAAAPVPSVLSGAGQVVAPTATGTGAAFTPLIRLTVSVPLAVATGNALTPRTVAIVPASVATAAGMALAPTTRLVILPPTAMVTGAASAIATRVYVPLTTATGDALTPLVIVGEPAPEGDLTATLILRQPLLADVLMRQRLTATIIIRPRLDGAMIERSSVASVLIVHSPLRGLVEVS